MLALAVHFLFPAKKTEPTHKQTTNPD